MTPGPGVDDKSSRVRGDPPKTLQPHHLIMPQTVDATITTPENNERWTVLETTDSTVNVAVGITVVLADATSGAITVNLPAAADNENRMIAVKKVDSSVNAVTVDGNATETIDGATTNVLSSQYDVVMLVSDGTNWNIV